MTDEELIARLRELTGTYGIGDLAADRIKALTEQLTAAQQDAKEADAYAEELEADRRKTYEALLKVSRIHGEVEAKLAKAVEALEALIQLSHDCEKELTEDLHHMDFCGESEPLTNARATLAEIKGESHE